MTEELTYFQKYYREHKQKIIARNVAWRAANRDKQHTHSATYRKKYKEKIKERSRRRYAENKDREKAKDLLRKYGLSEEEYAELSLINGGLCPVCNKRKSICVDHNHQNGDIRGKLCGGCNAALGVLEDGRLFESALKYLSKPPFKRS